jgi:predicted RNA-binding protein with PIN domain
VRWLIDGYNVIRREPDLRAREAESLEAGRRALLHLLARAHRDPRDEFTVVFDGARVAGGTPSYGRIRTIFSRPPHTADDELIRLARQWQSGAVVVSSDRRIQDAARRAGATALNTEQFLDGLVVAGSERPAWSEGGLKKARPGSDPADNPSDDLAGPSDPPELWAKKSSHDLPENPREKRGNPRKLSKKARRERRALGRLREP